MATIAEDDGSAAEHWDTLEFHDRFVQAYRAGEVIFAEGEEGRLMYVVVAGQVVICKGSGAGEKQLAVLESGEIFGEMALVDSGPRSATAKAAVDGTRLVQVDQARFVYLISQQPAFALAVIQAMSQRIRALGVQLAGD